MHNAATPINVTHTATRTNVDMGNLHLSIFPNGETVLAGTHGYTPTPVDVADMIVDLLRLANAAKAAHDGTWTP